MADRTITTRLTLDPSQYESGMQRAKKATEGLGTATKETGNQSASAMQRMARSARDNRAEWQQVGGALTVVGGAVTGLMTLVAATGIGYNNLRQTATQGLIAVTGSTEAATEQMRKLDEYGQNSWLMRDSLIRAQQQMTGFGIETEKVIPYMNALAEGVAATGGSNQDFEELARVMGKVNSSGKITAETFNEFGNRGIDAAQMIGDAMGKTAGQVREDVTSGALDAGAALDALAEGLVMNFEGSSDLVRGTFRGAVDDVTAAFRDISAIAMTPLVDPEGGGLLVGLLNQVSDLLFALRDLPPWLIQAGAGITTLGGLAAVGAGGFMLLVPRLVETYDALGRMGTFGPKAQSVLKGMVGPVGRLAAAGGAMVVTSVAVNAVMNALRDPAVARNAQDVAGSIAAIAEAGESLADSDLDTFMSNLTSYDLGFFEVGAIQAQNFGDVLDKAFNPSVTDKASRFFATLMGGTSYMEDYDLALQSMGDGLAQLAQDDLPAAQQAFNDLWMAQGGTDEAARRLFEAFPGYRDELIAVAEAAGMATDEQTLMGIATGYLTPEIEAATAAGGDYAGTLDAMAEAQAEARARLNEWIDSMGQAAASFGGVIDGYNAAAEAADSGTASMEDWISEMQKQAEAVANWRENTLTASAQIREDLPADMQEAGRAMVQEMVLAGDEGAQALQTFVDGTPEQRRQLIEAWSGTGYDVGVAFANELTNAPDGEIGADSFPAEQVLAALLGAIATSEEDVIVNGNPVPAENVLEALRRTIVHTEEDVTIAGNEVPARQALDAVLAAIEAGEEDVTIDGNRVPADRAVTELMQWIGRQERNVTVDANTSAAERSLNNFMMRHNGRTLTTYQQIRVLGQGMAATGGYMGDFATAMGLANGGIPKRLLAGGSIFGPGTSTSDSIPIWASKGEFMQRAAAVDKYGTDFMHAVNSLRFPVELARGLRGGGQVEARQYPAQYMPAPRPTPAAAPVSLDGAHITGTFRLEEDGFVRIVDGRIEQRDSRDGRRARMAGVG